MRSQISSALLIATLCSHACVLSISVQPLLAQSSNSAKTTASLAVKKSTNESTVQAEKKTAAIKTITARSQTANDGTAGKALPSKKELQAGNQSKSDNSAGSKKPEGKHSQTMPVSHTARAGLVPPPPPVVPTIGPEGMMGMGPMIFVGENVEYMPLADVLELKDKTSKDIEKTKRSLDDLTSLASEKSQRAVNFDALYAQGVVSKRELEASKREDESTARELTDQKQNLSVLEQKMARIEKRIADLNKKKSVSKSTTKTNKTKH